MTLKKNIYPNVQMFKRSFSFSQLLSYTFQFLQSLQKFLILEIPPEIPNNEAKPEIEIHPVTAKAILRKCSM